MVSTLHAVVSDEFLTTSAGGRVKLSRPVHHISELELLGKRTGITHFWVLPDTHVTSLGHEFVAGRDGFNIFQTTDSDGHQFKSPIAARCRKLQGGHEIFCNWPDKAFWWDVKDETDILCTIDYLQDVLGITVQWSPGHMGHVLLRKSISNEKWLEESTIPLHTIPFNDSAKDLHFFKPLTADLTGLWWHEYDGNSKYLASCQSVYVGTGTPAHLTEDELYRGGYIKDSIEAGLYRVKVLGAPCWPGSLPPIINSEWVTADILEYAMKQGCEVAVQEGWVFPDSHQMLRRWADTLWKARCTLNPNVTQDGPVPFPHRQGWVNAYHTIKDIATMSVGAFGINHANHKLARNNWRADIVGRSRITTLYHLKKFLDKGYPPHFVNVDAVGYFSPVASPVAAVPGIMDRATKLGGFKHENSLFVTEEIMQQAMAIQKNDTVRAAYKFIRKLAKGGK